MACVAALVPVFASKAASAPARKISAWIPNWDQQRAYNSFMANADLYDEALPYWYEMQSSTSISAYWQAEDPTVIAGIRSKGVRLVPTIANDFDGTRVQTMLSTNSKRTAHAQAIVNLVMNKGYDGIDVDYENMPAADRTNFTKFITLLASSLHAKGKVLDVAVYAKTSEPGTWDGPQSEDYAALGKVVDRLQLMTYDYHWQTSDAGPIAPLSWVDQVAGFAASVVPSSKVELGVNLYGYDWVGQNGETQMWDVMESRRTTYGATRNWDASAAEPWFTYNASGTAHTVYYGDAQSAGARLAIVDKYNLAGAAFWRLGGEDPAVWPVVRTRWSSTPTSTTLAPTTTTSTTRPSTTTSTTVAPSTTTTTSTTRPPTTTTTVAPTTTTSTTRPPSTTTTVKAATLPSAPQNLRIVSTSGGITLAWSAPAVGPVQTYEVCRGSWAAETCMWTTSATTFQDTSAGMWTWYYYRVAAVNSAGQGPYTPDVGGNRTA